MGGSSGQWRNRVSESAYSRLTAKGISQATYLEYEGAPHGLFATHKARLTQDLLDFLAK